jgi:hypothetical protein
MSTTNRRSARNQALPTQEVEILAVLRGFRLYNRASALFDAGWTLASIGKAFNPSKPRTTIKSWVDRGDSSVPDPELPEIPCPEYATPAEYIPKRPKSPGISPADLDTIQKLAPIARKYRSSMSDAHKAAVANRELTEICERLVAADVTVRELAEAAGVTYRAMARRLGRP